MLHQAYLMLQEIPLQGLKINFHTHFSEEEVNNSQN